MNDMQGENSVESVDQNKIKIEALTSYFEQQGIHGSGIEEEVREFLEGFDRKVEALSDSRVEVFVSERVTPDQNSKITSIRNMIEGGQPQGQAVSFTEGNADLEADKQLFFVTPESLQDDMFVGQLEAAVESDIHIVPVLIEGNLSLELRQGSDEEKDIYSRGMAILSQLNLIDMRMGIVITETRAFEGIEDPDPVVAATNQERIHRAREARKILFSTLQPHYLNLNAERYDILGEQIAISDILFKGEKPDRVLVAKRDFLVGNLIDKLYERKKINPNIFMSYAWADDIAPYNRVATENLNRLKSYMNKAGGGDTGVKLWRDIEQIKGGVNLSEEIETAIAQMKCFVVLVSDKSLSSKWVANEVKLAQKYGKPVVPIFLNDPRDLFFSATNLSQIVESQWKEGIFFSLEDIVPGSEEKYFSEMVAKLKEWSGIKDL